MGNSGQTGVVGVRMMESFLDFGVENIETSIWSRDGGESEVNPRYLDGGSETDTLSLVKILSLLY